MFRSRLSTLHQPLLQRPAVRQATSCAQRAQAKEERQPAGADDSKSSTITYKPPRRPLTQQFTHQITNQVPPLERLDLYTSDPALREFLTEENGGEMRDLAAELGTYHWWEQGHRANRHVPVLNQFDRYGQRIDEVQFHPAYHDLMQLAMRYGVSSRNG